MAGDLTACCWLSRFVCPHLSEPDKSRRHMLFVLGPCWQLRALSKQMEIRNGYIHCVEIVVSMPSIFAKPITCRLPSTLRFRKTFPKGWSTFESMSTLLSKPSHKLGLVSKFLDQVPIDLHTYLYWNISKITPPPMHSQVPQTKKPICVVFATCHWILWVVSSIVYRYGAPWAQPKTIGYDR